MGKFDGLVNAAGISTTRPFKMVTVDKLETFINTNVVSTFNLTRYFLKPEFVNKGASIVFISSIMGVVGEIGKSLYSISKGAIISGARSLALELASKRIRVNCVSPGLVATPMSEKAVYSQDEEALKKIVDMHPLGLGHPEDVANACIYLLSDAGRWITGTNIILDGGYTAK
jgi:NAD(P)-dependent dehydrogenase (short-subunit alcohol dehydrogenase family)